MLMFLGTTGTLMAKTQVTAVVTDDPGISDEDDVVGDSSHAPTATETPIVHPSSISKDEMIMDRKVDPYGDYRQTPLPTLAYVPMTHNFMTPLATQSPSPVARMASVTQVVKKKSFKPTPTPTAVSSAALGAK
jgi:hypothetical protein